MLAGTFVVLTAASGRPADMVPLADTTGRMQRPEFERREKHIT